MFFFRCEVFFFIHQFDGSFIAINQPLNFVLNKIKNSSFFCFLPFLILKFKKVAVPYNEKNFSLCRAASPQVSPAEFGTWKHLLEEF